VLVEGASLEALEQISRSASLVLEDIGGEDERWYLEVSSPGLERPLRAPRHFVGAIGSLVKVKTTPTTQGDRRIEGVLDEADDAGVVIAGRRLLYDEIDRARTVFEWGPPASALSGAGSTTPRAGSSSRSPRKQAKKRSTT
jgi:ribosome maturation factor RimP